MPPSYYVIKVIITHFTFSTEARSSPTCLYPCMKTEVELAQRCGLQNNIACTSIAICFLVHQGPSDLFDVIDFLCTFIVQQISKRLLCAHIS